MISVCFQGKPFSITVIQVYIPVTDAEEAGVDRFCEDLQYLLELIPKRKEFLDAFELWSQRRLLRDPWTSRRSNQSILKEINPEYSLEGLMLKLKRQYFGHLMLRTDSLEKTVMLGKTEGRRRRGQQKMRWLDSIINSVDMNLSKFWEIVDDRGM